MSAAEKLLHRLDKVRPAGPDKWTALCPAHDDRKPSLKITRVDDRVLIKCWSGCSAGEIVQALGLSLGDLFDERLTHHAGPVRPALPTVRELLAVIEFDLAVVECLLADMLCGVLVTRESSATAYSSLKSIRRVLEVCYANA